MTQRSVTHSTFVLERVYAAPPARVFAAWADPAVKAQWLGGGPEEWESGEHTLAFRVGGLDKVEDREHGTRELLDKLGTVLAGETVNA
jgi:uncharacterized protein YndB with AHSA1/START domain